jgi:S-adenosylmethionine:tRNA ribosyltransferase-isomerase
VARDGGDVTAPGETLDDYDFALPEALIAQQAVSPRDAARLLVSRGAAAPLGHHVVRELPALLPARSLLVVNDTRVVPARLLGRKADSGGRVELLLVEPFAGDGGDLRGQLALARASKPLRVGVEVALDGGASATVRRLLGDGLVEVDLGGAGSLAELLERCGRLPLPPYLRGGAEDAAGADRARYQTVYARAPGAIAAPTAGLHLTPDLLARLEAAGHALAAVTLHVGPGTFLPVRVRDVAAHRVPPERYEVSAEAAEALGRAQRQARPIIAVGTTAARTLETLARDGVRAGAGRTDLTILPGHRFGLVGGLLTNFHLPRSSLLLLVSALAGRQRVLQAYAEAVAAGYRFYSYGDASLWL